MSILPTRRLHRYTYADYVALELGSPTKHYHTIPSLRAYHDRSSQGTWITRVAIAGGRVAVECLNAELSVDEIYRKSSIH